MSEQVREGAERVGARSAAGNTRISETVSVAEKARRTREATFALQALGADTRTAALRAIKEALLERRREIFDANGADLARAQEDGVAAPLVKRLAFNDGKLATVAAGLDALIDLEDPVGRVLSRRELDQGLILSRVSTPIGVVGMIFESRPDALVQIASLAIKSGNALILKGGSEARESNRVLAAIIADASRRAGLPEGWIQLIESREDVRALLEQDEYVDLLVPRGSNEFVRYIMDNSRIPVLGHADGICHVYLDAAADPTMAEPLVVDSKTQYVAVCNAAETLLVHVDAAERLLPAIGTALSRAGVELRACSRARGFIPDAIEAREEDWSTEYLDMILAVKVVDSVDEAIGHINRYGSHHTDSIITTDESTAETFLRRVDSASVMWNASTRFADGYRYGLGAEIGISTARIHARGPVGIEGMMSYKWLLRGSGQIVSDYAEGRRAFTHRELDA